MSSMIYGSLFSFVCCLYASVLMITCEGTFYRPDFTDSKFCNNTVGNYTTNSTYETNLNTLLSTLTSNTQINYAFYNFSYGNDPNKVYAIGLCRGDTNPNECRTCLKNSGLDLTQRCPNQKEAISYDEKCMLRYSCNSMFATLDAYPRFYTQNPVDATDVDEFNDKLSELLRNLRGKAASGDSFRKYAADTAIVARFETIYSVVQCTPDLSSQDCWACVDWSISDIPNRAFENRSGGVLFRPSCFIRYEIYPFFQLISSSSLSPSLSPSPPTPTPGTF